MQTPAPPKLMDNPKVEVVRRIVIVMDIRSSTTMLEDLKQGDRMKKWRDVLNTLKMGFIRLNEKYEQFGFEVYKFVGDGWIIFFAEGTPRDIICEFIRDASVNYDQTYDTMLRELLQRPPVIGMSFGLDSGELLRFEMNRTIEYVGRPINVAARLQSVSFESDDPNYRAVASKPCFNSLRRGHSLFGKGTDDMVFEPRTTSLKNILGGERFECVMWQTL